MREITEWIVIVTGYACTIVGAFALVVGAIYAAFLLTEHLIRILGLHRALISFLWNWYQGLRWDGERWSKKEPRHG